MKNIAKIVMQDGTEIDDSNQISEFLSNANAKLIKDIETKIIGLRSQGAVKPLKLKATEEQIKKGAPASFELPITFDSANFFV
jgi:restriction endonuclease S subunit